MMAAAAISLVSCKKEESYVPAEKETGLQVYFSYETPTTYNLSEEGSFTIPIYRNEFSSAATVQITTEADSPLTAPSEVSFASGQNRADIVVSYDFDAIEEGKSYAISFAVANAAETTLYGLSSLKVSASLPSAWIDFLGPDGKPAKVTFTQGHWGKSIPVTSITPSRQMVLACARPMTKKATSPENTNRGPDSGDRMKTST